MQKTVVTVRNVLNAIIEQGKDSRPRKPRQIESTTISKCSPEVEKWWTEQVFRKRQSSLLHDSWLSVAADEQVSAAFDWRAQTALFLTSMPRRLGKGGLWRREHIWTSQNVLEIR